MLCNWRAENLNIILFVRMCIKVWTGGYNKILNICKNVEK